MDLLDIRTNRVSELKVFLILISVMAWLQKQFGDAWYETRFINEVTGGADSCKIILDLSDSVGMPHIEEIIVPITNRIWLDFSGLKSPLQGSYLMIWGHSPKLASIFFWTTEMVAVYSQGEYHDTSKADQLSRVGFPHASSRGGIRTSSSCN